MTWQETTAALMTLCEHPEYVENCVSCEQRSHLIAGVLFEECDAVIAALAEANGDLS